MLSESGTDEIVKKKKKKKRLLSESGTDEIVKKKKKKKRLLSESGTDEIVKKKKKKKRLLSESGTDEIAKKKKKKKRLKSGKDKASLAPVKKQDEDLFDDLSFIDIVEDIDEPGTEESDIFASNQVSNIDKAGYDIDILIDLLDSEEDAPPPEIDEDDFTVRSFFGAVDEDKLPPEELEEEDLAVPLQFSLDFDIEEKVEEELVLSDKPQAMSIEDLLKKSYGKVAETATLVDDIELTSTYLRPDLIGKNTVNFRKTEKK